MGYVPTPDWMDRGRDYGGMLISKDKICDGPRWNTRIGPKDPATEPYFPINQAAMEIVLDGDVFKVSLKTNTPNFKTFMVRKFDGPWVATNDLVLWKPRGRVNRLEAKTVNKFGVEGPVSLAVVGMRDAEGEGAPRARRL